MKKHLVLILILFFVAVTIYFIFERPKSVSQIELGGKVFSVEIADTNLTREMGLSGHVPLLDTQGMLFVFDKPGNYGFWMKDMVFPLDIIWFDEKLSITHIETSLSPNSYPTVFSSQVPSEYVLEINAGESTLLNLKIGDKLKFLGK